jgi:Fe-S cluster assembly protein SufB
MSSDQNHLKETDTEARFEFKKKERSSFQAEEG